VGGDHPGASSNMGRSTVEQDEELPCVDGPAEARDRARWAAPGRVGRRRAQVLSASGRSRDQRCALGDSGFDHRDRVPRTTAQPELTVDDLVVQSMIAFR
jgi:hypothetical protein